MATVNDPEVRAFLAENPEFAIDQTPAIAEHLAGLVDQDGCVRTRPDVNDLDGFFAARLKRRM